MSALKSFAPIMVFKLHTGWSVHISNFYRILKFSTADLENFPHICG
jgi:hypothetical protein